MEERELQFERDVLRSKCNLAYLITKDEWYAKKRDMIPEREIKIISKEDVTKQMRELKKLEKKLQIKK